jgi:hypothetical protein
MARSVLVACLAFAGVLVLAGVGWALVAGACLVFVLWHREPDWRAVAARVAGGGRALAGRVKAAPRRAVAMSGMGGGLALLPAGLGIWVGLGAAVASAGALFIGLSLLTGQGA